MNWIKTKYRTQLTEIMDDFTLEGEILREALDKIAQINQLLGGNHLTLQGVKSILNEQDKAKEITIIDVGCGNGDMLRTLAEFGKKEGIKLSLIGIDANNFTINHAQNLSIHYPNISYRCEDVFESSFKELHYDIVLCTLTLHHFGDNEIVKLLQVFQQNAALGIIINDLQRSALSYRLFEALCFVFRLNAMSKEDGLVSILRGFKKKELLAFSKQLQFKNYSIQWRWAFRYQWIIKTDDTSSRII
jgi:2-polyprenyl-3-methyl-5-hydroxy-6-metoxy-1,4-benzoquinol methylase